MPADVVERDLRLTDPLTEGPDVEALQAKLNRTAVQYGRILDFVLDEDGKLGPKTLLAAYKVAHIMGLNRSRLNEVEKEHLIAELVQRVIHRPRTRSEAQVRRGHERRENLRRKLDKRGTLAGVRVTAKAGSPHFGGCGDVMEDFVEPFLVKRGLPLGSGKRTPAENAAVGGSATSDHLTTKTTTAARDFPTMAGEDDARALAKALGIAGWQPNSFTSFTFSVGGNTFRAQILWGAGIDHGDHVHVGISTG